MSSPKCSLATVQNSEGNGYDDLRICPGIDGQTLDAQRAKLTEAGAEKIFAEKESGAKTDRKALRDALKALRKGDVLLVTRLDRLARSTLDLLNTLDTIGKAGAGFRSLADTWADTTTPHWGEGKWGGAEQVIVERKNGDQRALSSVMQNVFDAWLTLLRQPLPPIGEF